MRSWDISYSPGGKPTFWTIILRTQFLFANLFVSWFSMQFESNFLLVFEDEGHLFPVIFSHWPCIGKHWIQQKKKKKGNFTLGQCVRLAVEALLGSVMNDPGSSPVTWASAANRWPGPSACRSPWHHMASNIQEFLAYSFSSGSSIPYLLVLAQGKVPRTQFQVPSFPQKDQQVPILGLFVFAEF